jgi:Leucine-rich repeat (LRR) protein
MPALLRSYAAYRSQDENYIGDPSRIRTVSFKTWRVCVEDGNAVRTIPERVSSLRTLMVLGGSSSSPRDDGPPSPLMDVICQKFTSLRVLDLRDMRVETVSGILERLVQIRYLNLSNTWIEALPAQVENLVVLQLLILKNCSRLTSLPVEVGRLTQLRTLDISETPLLLDIQFNQLANLKELRCFRGFRPVAAGNNNNNNSGWAFSELSKLSKLTSLHILKLASSEEAGRLNRLVDMTGLRNLELLDEDEDARRSRIGRAFEALKPPERLTSFKIANFYGTELPSWLSPSHLTRLRRLSLHGCSHCHQLP